MSNVDSARAALQSQTVEYRDISGFPGYRVGNDGSVWSCRNRWRLPSEIGEWRKLLSSKDKKGYILVALMDGNSKRHTKRIARLVLEAFVGACPAGMECCHDPDRTKSNCCLDNLRWDTRKNNHADKIKHGTSQRGERASRVKLTREQVFEIRKLGGTIPASVIAEAIWSFRRHDKSDPIWKNMGLAY